jgi:hypothetical protein
MIATNKLTKDKIVKLSVYLLLSYYFVDIRQKVKLTVK